MIESHAPINYSAQQAKKTAAKTHQLKVLSACIMGLVCILLTCIVVELIFIYWQLKEAA